MPVIRVKSTEIWIEGKLHLVLVNVDLKSSELEYEEPESTNRISPVIDCCYAKICHHPVNLSTTRT